MIKAAVLGYGTVGSGIVEVINTNKEIIEKRLGDKLEVAYVLDLRNFPGDPVEKILVHDVDIIMNDPEVKIVAEAMGGIEPAYTFAKRALENGKSFCTSNKELVAKHGAELIRIAREKNLNFMFEASVGGGIPIIRPLIACVTPENILEINGILNGTTNYILTRMTEEGLDFNDVLKEAQQKGYAERNPEADVEGYDACRKIAILSSLAYGGQVDFEDIHTEGITGITPVDIEYAKSMGRAIKLIGRASNKDGRISAMVAPMMLSTESPLYAVRDVFNAITVTGNTLSDVMFYGKGAGKLPTASAVVSDMIEEAGKLGQNVRIIWDEEKLELAQFTEIENSFFVRLSKDEGFDEESVIKAFGDIMQVVLDSKPDEYAFITPVMTEGEFIKKYEGFENRLNMIRVG